MTRSIEFRGFSKEMKKWVYGGIHQYDGTTVIIHKQGINMSHMTEVDPTTVGEYTGKVDKNKMKIFEGDIIRDYVGAVGTVTYLNCSYKIKTSTQKLGFGSYANKCEVIGTIHD